MPGEKLKYRPDEERKETVTRRYRRGGERDTEEEMAGGTRFERRWTTLGNQDLHFSAEIGFAIKGFGIKFNSAGAPVGPGVARYFDLVVV